MRSMRPRSLHAAAQLERRQLARLAAIVALAQSRSRARARAAPARSRSRRACSGSARGRPAGGGARRRGARARPTAGGRPRSQSARSPSSSRARARLPRVSRALPVLPRRSGCQTYLLLLKPRLGVGSGPRAQEAGALRKNVADPRAGSTIRPISRRRSRPSWRSAGCRHRGEGGGRRTRRGERAAGVRAGRG